MPTVAPPKPTEEQKRSALLYRQFEERFGFSVPGYLHRTMRSKQIEELTEKALKDGGRRRGGARTPNSWRAENWTCRRDTDGPG